MARENESTSPVDPKLVEMLVCPACRTRVAAVERALQCINPECRRRYPIQDGIPVMLIDEAETVSPEEFEALDLPNLE